MYKILIYVSLFATLTLFSCNKAEETKQVSNETTEQNNTQETGEIIKHTINTAESVLKWTGVGVGKEHFGKINIQSGDFELNGTSIASGNIIIDMSTIVVEDITDEKSNKKLTNHLHSEDFFATSEFSTAKLEIVNADDLSNVKANLTIKNITNEIVFPLEIINESDKVILKSNLSFDRTKFDVIYNSGNFFQNLGDYLIKDMVEIEINLVAKAA